MPNANPAATSVLQGLAPLIVTPERAAWILATYPPEETGRPGIIVAQPRGRKVGKVRKLNADRDVGENDGEETWRTTVEIAGDEDALEESGFAVAAD